MLSTLICLMSAVSLWSVTSCDHVVKRTDDTNPLEVIVTRLSQEVSELRARLQVLEQHSGQKAAFRAELPGVVNVAAGTPVRFRLVHQTGGGYDSNTGVYTAPLSGWYTFQYQLYPHDLTSSVNLDLVKSNVLVTRSFDGGSGSSAVATTVHVNAGDTLWVQISQQATFWQTVHSYFTGTLVVPDN